jgi:hypothetical protein
VHHVWVRVRADLQRFVVIRGVGILHGGQINSYIGCVRAEPYTPAATGYMQASRVRDQRHSSREQGVKSFGL